MLTIARLYISATFFSYITFVPSMSHRSPVDLVHLIPVVAIATIKFYQASCNLWRGETAVDGVNASASAPTLRDLPSNEGYTAGISAKVP